MKNNKILKNLRYVLLGIFLIHITVETYLHQVLGGGEAPSIHALCPYGALESLYQVMFSGTFVEKIFSGTLIILVISVAIALIFRRSFCGLICPFGALQEFFGIIGKKIFKKRFVVPEKIDKPMRYLKYVVLAVTLYFAWKTAGLWVNPYDPWAAYGHISEGISALFEEYLIGFIILIAILIGSLLYDRFFCKYLCPMGSFYGLISKLSLGKIVRNENSCVNCNLCSKSCPMNIKVSKAKEIKSAECISCQSCVLSCPKKGTLEYKVKNKSVKPAIVILLVLLIFFGAIGATKVIGMYQVTPSKITSETKLTPEEIKGYMTLEEIATGLKLDLNQVYEKLDLPNSVPKDTKLKEIKDIIPDFEVEEAKEKLKK
ncbi:4Fe-4S binding protein [Clostridium cellulovorans]|uniref:4Fe-4S ferredoxin iron-sulfur binding domain protein n=1 Tax=Clostridium cellulovorans (strain ATCC 35296 / DSM 3052 / OCM 3 / 743B) TaxID=573061 RepID=D9SPI4_CLOC7|nr:4Fe-4S binding protein [Clostridium cellulovorans]ADL50033.1 4Fe-4S ferredoxin iron-sulfur binding domain protein [Clostridium cellulovorans 743B]